MLQELPKENYNLIEPFLASSHLSLNILPIIHQTFSGHIWVDDSSNPSCAYVFDNKHGHFIFGDITNNISTIIDFLTVYFNDFPRKDKEYCSLIYANEWNLLLGNDNKLPIKDVQHKSRELYKLDHLKISDWKSYLPEGFSLYPVSQEVLKLKLQNLNYLEDELLVMWDKIDNFFTTGFGSCVVYEDSLVGFCLGEYYVNTELEKKFGIGIETFPEFQHKGIATAMASWVLERGLSLGYTIYWDCFKDNIPSRKTAIKLGFVLDMEYEVLTGYF